MEYLVFVAFGSVKMTASLAFSVYILFEESVLIFQFLNNLFFAFFNALDLNNQKNSCLPSIFQFEWTITDLNRPRKHFLFQFL